MLFKAPGTIAVGATKTALIVGSTANIRPRIKKFNCSCVGGAPTSDQALEFAIRRATALGTSTALTLAAPDPSDTAGTPVVTAGSNCTVEPTYSGTSLEDLGHNPRMTYVWQPYEQYEEIILPATASNGVGFQIQAIGGAAGSWNVNASVLQ